MGVLGVFLAHSCALPGGSRLDVRTASWAETGGDLCLLTDTSLVFLCWQPLTSNTSCETDECT